MNCFCMILYFTQVNKALARSLGVCLGKDVVVLMDYTPAAPTFFAKTTTCGCHGGHICHFGFPNQSQPVPWGYANGGPYGHHLHQP